MVEKICRNSKILLALITILVFSSISYSAISISDVEGGSQEIVDFKKVDEGESLSITIVSDSNSPIYARNLPEGSVFDGTLFQWTPTDVQAGHYRITFTSAAIFKTVGIIVSNTQFAIPVKTEFEYLFTATDPDGDNVELTTSNLPSGATFEGSQYDPKLFIWEPTMGQVGLHEIVLTATDSPTIGPPKQDISNIKITVHPLGYEDMPYDFNKDGLVDIVDFTMFSQHWLAHVPEQEPVALKVWDNRDGSWSLLESCDSFVPFLGGTGTSGWYKTSSDQIEIDNMSISEIYEFLIDMEI